MNRKFDTNYILNDVYDNVDGVVRMRRFDSNYVWNAIYDPDLPGIRVKDVLGLVASSVTIDASQFDGLLNDTINDVQKLADFLDNLTFNITTINATLLSSNWTGLTQTITVSGVTSTNEISWDASTLADNILAGKANLFCSAQSVNTLTFQCSTTPVNDINIKVTIR